MRKMQRAALHRTQLQINVLGSDFREILRQTYEKSYEDLEKFRQVAQLSQRDRGAGCVIFLQKWKTQTGKQYFSDTIAVFSTIVT